MTRDSPAPSTVAVPTKSEQPERASMCRRSTAHSGCEWSSWLTRRITLMRGTLRVMVIEGESDHDEKARRSALKRALAHERERICLSIGTGGIYPDDVVLQV